MSSGGQCVITAGPTKMLKLFVDNSDSYAQVHDPLYHSDIIIIPKEVVCRGRLSGNECLDDFMFASTRDYTPQS